jgi:phosphoribosylaminoimidazolecarboxamide formyltransferase/IMP cyclohydrolase
MILYGSLSQNVYFSTKSATGFHPMNSGKKNISQGRKMKIQRALISVSDKSGIVKFAQELAQSGIEIISTGGTAQTLLEAGLTIIDISTYTGFPEMLGGRVKTLQPQIHGGILWRRDNEKDKEEVLSHGIQSIDLVVVNLYPFEQTIAQSGVTLDEAIEQIDIGGPTLLRASAKNYKFVAVVVDPADYSTVVNEMRSNNGQVSEKTRFNLAKKVFQRTSQYDTIISKFLEKQAG